MLLLLLLLFTFPVILIQLPMWWWFGVANSIQMYTRELKGSQFFNSDVCTTLEENEVTVL